MPIGVHLSRRRSTLSSSAVLILFLIMAGTSNDIAADTIAPDYADAIQRLQAVVKDELDRGIVPGVSIALVDDQKTVYARGFGIADRMSAAAMTADSVHRAGSISKVFTAWSVMQLVDEGRLDIDAPVATYVPEFRIRIPFEDARPITLRQLMSHRSGMIRESPVGSYFDDAEPGIERTIASVADCALVYLPESRTQYSNLGPTLAGLAVQKVSGKPFDRFQQERIFEPAGMKSSAWYFKDAPRDRAAAGYMRVADGKGGFGTIEANRARSGAVV
jgi:CubicO group peptidase (beta-lactamase class C family)